MHTVQTQFKRILFRLEIFLRPCKRDQTSRCRYYMLKDIVLISHERAALVSRKESGQSLDARITWATTRAYEQCIIIIYKLSSHNDDHDARVDPMETNTFVRLYCTLSSLHCEFA